MSKYSIQGQLMCIYITIFDDKETELWTPFKYNTAQKTVYNALTDRIPSW